MAIFQRQKTGDLWEVDRIIINTVTVGLLDLVPTTIDAQSHKKM